MQTKPTMKIFDRDCSRLLRLALAALLILGQLSAGYAAPQGGIVRGGSAQITSQGNKTLIQQTTPRAIIDWRSFGVTADEAVRFMQPSTQSATLNRVTGNQVSFLLGRLDANGQILLINPNGIIFGKGAQINVGSLIASTANISNNNFMQGNLIFDQPGKPGAGIVNLGTITAKEGGLIALVAPHIRNDGIIEAKLGKVMLGAADTFTIDLYGDGLINLALSDASLAEIQGTLIAQTGTIDVAGGKAVLITAAVAKGVVDSLINMSGAILADSATQEGGRIVLSARGGNVDVSGQLSATGTKGGQIEILGDQIHLFSPAYLDASGLFGGGILHIGGAYQGSGDTYRSKSTFIDPGVILQADAQQGKGGEVIVWSDEFTSFQGSIFARDGGRVEVSGKNTLFFDGAVDAGKGGSLLLDPYDFTIGAAEAGLIARVLWTGTSTSVSADHNLTVNYDINGTGRLSGGGLTLTAGNNLSINNNIYTNNGAINLFATSGTISLLSGKTIWAGTAPITLRSGSHLYNGAYIVGGPLSLISTAGSVFVDGSIFLTNPNNPSNANLTIQAASDVTISQPVVAESDGNGVTITAGNDITVDNQINTSGGRAGGTISLTANRNLNVNDHIVTNNGAISLFATSGTISLLSGKSVWAGTAPITIQSGGNLSDGTYLTGGPTSLTSTAGSVSIAAPIFFANPSDPANANLTIQAATDVNISQPIVALADGNGVTITAGNDIAVNNPINTSEGRAGGTISLTANRNLTVNDDIATNNGAISFLASTGTISLLTDKVVWAGTAPITVQSAGSLTDGATLTGGQVSLRSTAGSVSVAGPVFFGNQSDHANANLTIQAATDVTISQPIVALADGNGVTITAGNDIAVNNPINTSEGRAGGTISLTSTGGNVAVNDDIATNNGAISLRAGTVAGTGTVSLASDKVVWAGTAPITVQGAGNLSNGSYITSGALSLVSTAGSVAIANPIDPSIGNLTLNAANDVTISQSIVSLNDGSSVTVTAGNDINVNGQIDGSGGVTGGTVTLTTTSGNVNINDHIVTNDGAITISAGGAFAQLADGTDTFGAPLTKQVRSGSAPITVTSGGDLSFGSLVTTGELTVTSTAADVNIDVPIYETTGKTTVNAGRDININQGAVNTTSGADLIMAAGRDINVNAKVGPWDRSTLNSGEAGISRNAVAGGSISLTAGRSILLHDAVASYKGDSSNPGSITLTAGSISQPTGTVLMDNGIKVVSDVGAIQVTGYGDLTNGPYINDQDISVVNGLPTTGYFTAGALGLRSTAANLTVNQTIPDTTGPVTLQAGNGIQVNQRIYSDNADITLIAGPGGITMTTQADPAGGLDTIVLSDIDPRLGNLTLISEGDIKPSGTGDFVLRTLGNLIVRSTNGTISEGTVTLSRRTGDGEKYPALIELSGSLGISNFETEHSRNIKAISDRGSIEGLGVNGPSFLEVIARDNIVMTGYLGNANLYAGGDIQSQYGIFGRDVTEKAGGNITTGSANRNVLFIDSSTAGIAPFSYEVSSLNLSAGTNPFSGFSDTYQIAGTSVKPLKDAWTAAGPGNITVTECAWVAGEGGLVGTATGSINMNSIHVSYSLMPAENTTDPRQAMQPLTLTANNGISIPGQIETMGPVALISENGNIAIGQVIGPHVTVQTPDTNVWNPEDKGVASLTVRAGNETTGQGSVSIQSARAEGNIDIRAYGNGTTTGLISYGSSAFESVSGTTYLAEYINGNPTPAYTYVAGDDYETVISATPVDRLPVPLPIVPAVSPGPLMSGPAAPTVPGALPPNAPSVPNVSGTVEPTSPGGSSSEPSGPGSSPSLPGQPDVAVPELAAGSASLSEQVEPERATGSTSLSEIIPGEDEEEEYAEEVENGKETTTSESQGKQKIMVGDGAKDKTIIEFPAGRGVSQSAVSEEILGTSTIPILPYARRER